MIERVSITLSKPTWAVATPCFISAAQSAAGLVGSLQRAGVARFRIELVRETREDVARIVQTYVKLLRAESSAADVWRTLRTEGGYGVVRGSLRVLHGG